jgi:hypothetical protein
MKNDDLWEKIESNQLMTMDGYDDCIVGIGYRYNNEQYVVYDTNKIVNKLMEDGMSYHEACEFHEFNQACAYVGPNTPGFIELI